MNQPKPPRQPLLSTVSFEERLGRTRGLFGPEPADSVAAASRRPDGLPEQDREVSDVAWSVVSYLLTGILLWGGAGWLIDRWLDRTTALFTPIGIVVGVCLALYLVFARVGWSAPDQPLMEDRQRRGR